MSWVPKVEAPSGMIVGDADADALVPAADDPLHDPEFVAIEIGK
jgi:hypothetical protein